LESDKGQTAPDPRLPGKNHGDGVDGVRSRWSELPARRRAGRNERPVVAKPSEVIFENRLPGDEALKHGLLSRRRTSAYVLGHATREERANEKGETATAIPTLVEVRESLGRSRHRSQEFAVGLRLSQAAEQELHRFDGGERAQNLA